MKTLKIGEITLNVATELKDVTAKRFEEFKLYAVAAFEEAEVPTIAAFYNEVKKRFNTGDMYELVKVIENYRRASDKKSVTNMHRAFALIATEEGEDLSRMDGDWLTEKVNRWMDQGMLADVSLREVYFFMKRQPLAFRGYGEIISLMFTELLTNGYTEQELS